MSTYVIGDIQGCLEPLQNLLIKINYHPDRDQLWFTGDLVNRGPHSLQTLRFIKALNKPICVLGNHDLAFIAMAEGVIPLDPNANLTELIHAPDRRALVDWLRHRPVLHHDQVLGFTMTHAGIFPQWDLLQAKAFALELETVLRDSDYVNFLQYMYGDTPTHWQETLTGMDRLRFITNAFTRMRFCTEDGGLDLESKGTLAQHKDEIPWFLMPKRRTEQDNLIFGHWASLEGKCDVPRVYALDTGCVWGYCLTALCLETRTRISVDCSKLS